MTLRFAALALVIALGGCSAVPPKIDAALVMLTDKAKEACAQQAFFNAVAGSAAMFGPQAAAGAAAASAIVGVGCTWVNS